MSSTVDDLNRILKYVHRVTSIHSICDCPLFSKSSPSRPLKRTSFEMKDSQIRYTTSPAHLLYLKPEFVPPLEQWFRYLWHNHGLGQRESTEQGIYFHQQILSVRLTQLLTDQGTAEPQQYQGCYANRASNPSQCQTFP